MRAAEESLLRLVHTLTPNEHEAAILTGERDAERAGRKLLDAGCRNVVITLGARGAMLVSAQGTRRFPAPKVSRSIPWAPEIALPAGSRLGLRRA